MGCRRYRDRLRFNWGFHDGAREQARDGGPAQIRIENLGQDWQSLHHDPVYVAGWNAGFAAAAAGQDTASSDPAWVASGRKGTEDCVSPYRLGVAGMTDSAVTLSAYHTRNPEMGRAAQEFLTQQAAKGAPAVVAGDECCTPGYMYRIQDGSINPEHPLSVSGFNRYLTQYWDPEWTSFNAAAQERYAALALEREQARQRAEEEQARKRAEEEAHWATKAARKRAIDEQAQAVRFKRTTADVGLTTGDTVQVTGLAYRGVLVHRSIRGYHWTLTQASTGLGTLLQFHSQRAAKTAAVRLGDLGDWSQDIMQTQDAVKTLLLVMRASKDNQGWMDPYVECEG